LNTSRTVTAFTWGTRENQVRRISGWQIFGIRLKYGNYRIWTATVYLRHLAIPTEIYNWSSWKSVRQKIQPRVKKLWMQFS